jgi:hypothetical protein
VKLKHGVFFVILGAVLGASYKALLYRHEDRHASALVSQVYDFGVRRAGPKFTCTFPLRNPLSTPLEVESVKSTCSCTALDRDAFTGIAAKSTYDLDVEVYLPEKQTGAFNSAIHIAFKGHDPIALKFTGTVVAGLPLEIDFGRVARGSQTTSTILIHPFPTHPIEVRVLHCDERYINVDLLRSDSMESPAKAILRLADNAPRGYFETPLVLELNDAVDTKKTIMVAGDVLSGIMLQPENLAFGLIKPGEQKTESSAFLSPYGKKIAISAIEVLGDTDVSWTIIPVGDGITPGRLDVTLTGGKPTEQRIIHDELHIIGKAGEEEEIVTLTLSALNTAN